MLASSGGTPGMTLATQVGCRDIHNLSPPAHCALQRIDPYSARTPDSAGWALQ